MLVRTVAGVENRDSAGELGRQPRRAFLRMTHHDCIDVGADDGNGVGQSFAFFAQRGVTAVRKAHCGRAKAMNCGFKRQAGTGRGLKEAAGDHLVLQQFRLRMGFQLCGGVQCQFQLFTTEVVD